jgi:hypothetical protein
LELQGISFHAICPNQGSINQLEIISVGLEIDNSVIKPEIDGSVTGMQEFSFFPAILSVLTCLTWPLQNNS